MKGFNIAGVEKDSTASELGLQKGDEIISINGREVPDYLAYRYLIADEKVSLLVRKGSGELIEMEVEKDEEDDLGVVPPPMRVRCCNNKCVFCFVAQMPRGLRRTLYVKDEDYRHSFLHGNYITLTTLKDEDYERIIRERLSPLYVSVHTTDDAARRSLLGNPKAPAVMEGIGRLAGGGITLHAQAVVCPGMNDGEMLLKTVEDLAALYPKVASLAVVPVGLTKHREGLYPLKPFTRSGAARLLDMLDPARKRFRKKHGVSFVYPSDEFYVKAGRGLPRAGEYDGYPQIDNGVGLVRDFLTEFKREKKKLKPSSFFLNKERSKEKVLLVTGVSFAPYLKQAAEDISLVTGLKIKVVPVKNELFGHTVTVTGLLSGMDIAAALKGKKAGAALVPSVTVRDGDGLFLDDLKPEDVERLSGVKVVMTEPAARGLVAAIKVILEASWTFPAGRR